jgi:predicted phage terminase large subunit-like protein
MRQLIQLEAKKELARRSIWYFCKLVAPDFYREDRPHLKHICDTLQALYEGRITKSGNDFIIHETPQPNSIKKLMINMPPQHGKSRTLINFANWVFGKNASEKIITCSYNDSTASDFSRYVRDGISTTKNQDEVVYSDIFPKTKIKQGNAGFEKWALDGQHFSYLGAGVGGSITSKGGSILIVDDPIKGAEEALNESHLDKIWLWYTSTFLSRVSAVDGEPIEIINMTRWSKKDLCGRILSSEEASEWYVLKLEAFDEVKNEMLCPSLLSYKRYNSLSTKMDESIFRANYHQEPLDKRNAVFGALKTYKESSLLKYETSLAYIDVSDQGSDYLALAIGRNIKTDVYITGVVFNQANADVTLHQCAEVLKKHQVKYCRVEANAMGAMFARNLQKLCPNIQILQATSTANKHTRIIMDAYFVCKNFLFLDKSERTPEYQKFIENVEEYNKEGKVKHDDAPDCLTGLAIFIRAMVNYY